MKLLKSTAQFENEILQMARSRPEFFYASTFNLKVDSLMEMVIKILPKNCDVKILVGVNEDIHKKKLEYLRAFLKKHDIGFKITTKHHVKLILTNKKLIIGSSNLTRSDWRELNISITNKSEISQLRKHFLTIYQQTKKIQM
jgi:hypothetical protein